MITKKKLFQALPSINLKKELLNKYTKLIVFPLVILISASLFLYILNIPSGNILKQNLKKNSLVSYPNQIVLQNNYSELGNIKLLFVGDIMLARNIGYSISNGHNPFKYVQDFFSDYDVVIGNLETTIASANTGYSAAKGYNFKAPVKAAQTLNDAGIQLVSLANNHTMDFGEDALLETMANLQNQNIGYFGAGKTESDAFKPFYMHYKDTKISIMGFNDVERWITDVNDYHGGSAYLEEEKVRLALKEATDNSDIQIVFPHWGEEYTTLLTDQQKKWSKFFIDVGADLVVGSHPHIVQSTEVYKGKYILYSLGNFVFDGMKGIYLADKGEMLEVVIANKQIESHKEYSIEINWDGFPAILK